MSVLAGCACWVWIWLAPQGGPELVLRGPTPAVVRLGEASHVGLVVKGTTSEPSFSVPKVAGLRVQVVPGGTQEIRSYVNGRITLERSVNYTLVLTPQREGKFTLPAFSVRVEGKELTTRPITIEAVRDMEGEDLAFVRVRPSAERVWVHEPIRFTVVFGVDERLRLVGGRARDGTPYSDVEVRAPWLDDLEGAVPIEVREDYANAQNLVLNGHVQKVDYTPGVEIGGRTYRRFRFEKAFLPVRIGAFDLPGPMLRFSVDTGRRRGLFNEEVAPRRFYAYGEPVHFEVRPLPEEGRPVPFYDAVGRFAVRTRLDRRQVRVGDSVKLILEIEGLGNTEFLRVPRPTELGGFHVLGRVVERAPEKVVVTYDLTPLRADLSEVPGLEWNWFDTRPGVETYRTIRTDPLPIRVLPLPEGTTLPVLPGDGKRLVTPGVDDIFDIVDLDGPPVVSAPPPPRWRVALWIAAPWLVFGALALGLRWRARRAGDTRGRRARSAAARAQRRLGRGEEALEVLVDYLADRLGVPPAAVVGPDLADRLVRSGLEEKVAREAAAAVERGVAARYGGEGALERSTVRELVQRLERSWRSGGTRGAGAVFLLFALGPLLAAGAPAQGVGAVTPAAAIAAYRSGDYARAAELFAELAKARPVDRRILFNLGNALYRQGRHAEALLAWERARLAMPRDPELLANIRLVRRKLGLRDEQSPFLEAIAELRAWFTRGELLAMCVAGSALAAAFLLFGRRRRWLRVLGAAALAPALLLALELLWWGPSRPPAGIVLRDETAIVAEPREGLEPVARVRAGVRVEVLGEGPRWLRVRAGGKKGYVPADAVGVVR